jgi:hypothetical protein
MPLRIGIVGLDSSHAVSLARRCNAPDSTTDARVVAAWAGGSPDAPLSRDRVSGFAAEVTNTFGVPLMETPEAVATIVDAVAIMSMDGRTHASLFSKITPTCRSVFINKPLTTSRLEAQVIASTARRHAIRWFSASALRFAVTSPAPTRRAVVECPLWFEPANTGWFWYGVHGVELILRLMGPGVAAARVEPSSEHEILHLDWRDRRTGVVVGHYARDTAFTYACDDAPPTPVDPGADRLEKVMLKFFAGGDAPVTPAETIEVIAVVEAANLSRASGGRRITLEPIP